MGHVLPEKYLRFLHIRDETEMKILWLSPPLMTHFKVTRGFEREVLKANHFKTNHCWLVILN